MKTKGMWTLAQTMIWVLCAKMHDPLPQDAVATLIDRFASRPPEPEPPMVDAYALVCAIVAEPGCSTWLPGWTPAFQAISDAMREGLPVFGRPRNGSHIEQISPLDCELLQFKDGAPPYAEIADGFVSVRFWSAIRFDSADVTSHWPLRKPPKVPPLSSAEIKRTLAAFGAKKVSEAQLRSRLEVDYPNHRAPRERLRRELDASGKRLGRGKKA
jgi:hypothetical protein